MSCHLCWSSGRKRILPTTSVDGRRTDLWETGFLQRLGDHARLPLYPHQNKTKWSVFPISPGYYSRPKRNWRRCWDKILKAWLLAADREMSPPFSPKQTLLRGEGGGGRGGQGSTFCHPPKERPLNWGWCKKKKNKSESKRKMSLLVTTCYFWFVKIIK